MYVLINDTCFSCSAYLSLYDRHWFPPFSRYDTTYFIRKFIHNVYFIIRASLAAQLVKKSTSNAGEPSLIPGSGRSPEEGIGYPLQYSWASLVAQLVKNPPAMQETWVRSLGLEDPLEKGTTTHSKVFWPGEFWVAKYWTQLSNFHFHFSCFIIMLKKEPMQMKWWLYISLNSERHLRLFLPYTFGNFPSGSVSKEPFEIQKTWVQSLGWEDTLEKEMATCSSILAWEILWTEETGGPQSMGSQEADTTWWLNHYHHHLLYCSDAVTELPMTVRTVMLTFKYLRIHSSFQLLFFIFLLYGCY